MSYKTTLLLAVVLAGLLVGTYVIDLGGDRAVSDESTSQAPNGVTRKLLDDPIEEATRIVVQRQGDEPWSFERDEETDAGGRATWRMTAPVAFRATSYQVDRLVTELNRWEYDVCFEPGQKGATSLADAGLDPPLMTLTITDAADRAVTALIGRAASPGDVYVKLADEPTVYEVHANTRTLVKNDAVDYRDQQFWSFKPDDATSLQITQRDESGTSTAYTFARADGMWKMIAPMTSRVTDKIGEGLRALSYLRAGDWHMVDEDKLIAYGLDPAPLVVRVTIETEQEVDETADDGAEQAGPQPSVVTTYELHISDMAPIGEDTKVYVRVPGENMIATLPKTTAEKLMPDKAGWRDMGVTAASVTRASRVEVVLEAQTITLVYNAGGWFFDKDDRPADTATVTALLDAIDKLEAVAFVDDAGDDVAGLGLSTPRAEVRVTIPGQEHIERIAVGAYTDEASRRLTYVRANDATTVAKVRSADVEPLLRPALMYEDRSVFRLPPTTITELAIKARHAFADAPVTTTFVNDNGTWRMSSPVQTSADSEALTKLVGALATLHADDIAGRVDQAAEFGLADPEIEVTIVQAAPDGEEATRTAYTLLVGNVRGRVFARRADRSVVYEIPRPLRMDLLAEHRVRKIMSFHDQDVTRFAIHTPEGTHAFVRGDASWTYESEPDWPLNDGKVTELLLRISDLRAQRFLPDSETAGLGLSWDQPAQKVTVSFADGMSRTLRISSERCAKARPPGFYAIADGVSGVFLISAGETDRIQVKLDSLEGSS